MKKLLLLGLALAVACGGEGPPSQDRGGATAGEAAAGGAVANPAAADLFREGPPPLPTAEQSLRVGEWVDGADTVSVFEEDGELFLLPWGGDAVPLEGAEGEISGDAAGGGATRTLTLRGRTYHRISLGGEEGGTFQIEPVRPPEALRAEALAATPPTEEGEFRTPELVEVVTLDPTIHLDIRYAGTNNFMGEVFYSSPRAFLQRPAAEAVVRANAWLKERGYGLLIHDGYRPWYVTKMFWDATPEELKVFVADPASGSRHNRGCAVDLTLYDLETGEPVLMPGGYDEMSPRSYPDYQGGTTRRRWFRELLRTAMEAQDFTVYEAEWWHFDYKDWRLYRIGNLTFEEIG